MTWIVIALVATLLWSITNFIDKLLLERFVPERSTALVFGIYPAVFSLIFLPFLFYFNPHALDADLINIVLFLFAGGLEITAIIFYLRALQHEDTSTVVPFFQAVPVFSFILGFFLLGEMLSIPQILSGVGIVMGGILLSYEFNKGASRRFRLPLIIWMLSASFCYALFDAVFKFGALREDYWTAIVWQHTGIVLTAVGLLAFRKRYRERFIEIVRNGGRTVFAINISNEGIYATGIMLSNYALLLAPIALVSLITAYHPAFVFIIGLLLTLFAPRLLKEEITKKRLLIKALAITLMLTSSIFLILNS